MNEIDLAQLRNLFLNAPESAATRFVAISLSLTLAAVVLWLVRRRYLREEYTPIWLGVAAGVLLLCLNLDVLRAITTWIGAWTPSSTIFFLGEVFLMVICLNFAVRLSRMSLDVKTLAQELTLLRAAVEGRDAPRSELHGPR